MATKKPKKPTKSKSTTEDFFTKLAKSCDEEETDYFATLDAHKPDAVDLVIREVEQELHRAVSIHGPMRSAHKGWAVIHEEMEELWDEVKKKQSKRSREKMREEAIQIAAMATRFVVDVVDKA
jgi:hypothetical protein